MNILYSTKHSDNNKKQVGSYYDLPKDVFIEANGDWVGIRQDDVVFYFLTVGDNPYYGKMLVYIMNACHTKHKSPSPKTTLVFEQDTLVGS